MFSYFLFIIYSFFMGFIIQNRIDIIDIIDDTYIYISYADMVNRRLLILMWTF